MKNKVLGLQIVVEVPEYDEEGQVIHKEEEDEEEDEESNDPLDGIFNA